MNQIIIKERGEWNENKFFILLVSILSVLSFSLCSLTEVLAVSATGSGAGIEFVGEYEDSTTSPVDTIDSSSGITNGKDTNEKFPQTGEKQQETILIGLVLLGICSIILQKKWRNDFNETY